MNRRSFLTRSGLALGALIVGDEALALADRLSHKKVWALGDIRNTILYADGPQGVAFIKTRLTPPGHWFFVNKSVYFNYYTIKANP